MTLKLHKRRVHQKEKPFACENCGKRFFNKGALDNHVNRCKGIKPYKCDECGKCFSAPADVRVHKQSHSEGRPYSCQLCGKTYKRQSHLYQHKKRCNSSKIEVVVSFD